MDGPRLLCLVAVLIAAAGALGCGDDDDERFSDKRIVDALGLEETDGGYAINGDPFCEVSSELLNDSSEVEDADSADQPSLVIASAEGNVGVEGVAPFACQREAREALNKLDPRPKEE